MPLAGLIIASEEAEQARLPACLPVAGTTLLEYQVRQARVVGAGHIVVLAARMPQELVAAIDRLKADGIDAEIARTARDVADRIHPEESLLVIAGGIVAPAAMIARVAQSPNPVLLTRDAAGAEGFERIDAASHWAGLALLDGSMLRETASMLGDWVLGPTLLRLAVQRGVCRDGLAGNDADLVRFVDSLIDARAANRALAADNDASGNFLDRIFGLVGRQIIPPLLERPGLILPMAILPLAMLALAAALGLVGWVSTGFLLVVLANFPGWLAKRLSLTAGQQPRSLRWHDLAERTTVSFLMLVTGWYAVDELGRTVFALGSVAALHFYFGWFQKQPLGPIFGGTIMLLACLTGYPDIGLVLVALAGLSPWQRARSEFFKV